MSRVWTSYNRFIDMLTLRERILFVGVTLLLLFFVWFVFFARPAYQQRQGDITTFNANSSALVTMKQELQVLKNQYATEKQKMVSQQEQTDESQVVVGRSELENLLAEYEENTVKSDKIKNVLQELLTEQHSLELLQLTSLPSNKLLDLGQNVHLYKHEFIIKLKGTYFATLYYLQDIEKLKWRIYWDGIDYHVTKYPYGEVTIKLYTLSSKM